MGLGGSHSPLDVTALSISWRQLTAIDLQLEHSNLLSFDKCLEILSQTERLERFSVNVECVLTRTEDFRELILLPKLETLDLVLHGGASGSARFEHDPLPCSPFASPTARSPFRLASEASRGMDTQPIQFRHISTECGANCSLSQHSVPSPFGGRAHPVLVSSAERIPFRSSLFAWRFCERPNHRPILHKTAPLPTRPRTG